MARYNARSVDARDQPHESDWSVTAFIRHKELRIMKSITVIAEQVSDRALTAAVA